MILERPTSKNEADSNRVFEALVVASSVLQVKDSHTIAHWDIHLPIWVIIQCDNLVMAHLRSDEKNLCHGIFGQKMPTRKHAFTTPYKTELTLWNRNL